MRRKKYNKEIIDNAFNKVIKDLQLGSTISNSLKGLKISNAVFYKHITKEQKKELQEAKVLCSNKGFSSYGKLNLLIHNVELSFED